MDEMKQAKINQLMAEHNLPKDILADIVGEAGVVDTGKLSIALRSAIAGAAGKAALNQDEIDRLIEEYYQAQDRRDPVTMIRVQSRIYSLGGRLTHRKKKD